MSADPGCVLESWTPSHLLFQKQRGFRGEGTSFGHGLDYPGAALLPEPAGRAAAGRGARELRSAAGHRGPDAPTGQGRWENSIVQI